MTRDKSCGRTVNKIVQYTTDDRFSIMASMTLHTITHWFGSVRCSSVEYNYIAFCNNFAISALFHYNECYCYWDVYVHVHSFRNTDLSFLTLIILVLQLLKSQDVSAPGPSLRLLDWTCHQWTPLCQTCILHEAILQGSSRLSNWLSSCCLLRGLTICLLYVCLLFETLVLNTNWSLNLA